MTNTLVEPQATVSRTRCGRDAFFRFGSSGLFLLSGKPLGCFNVLSDGKAREDGVPAWKLRYTKCSYFVWWGVGYVSTVENYSAAVGFSYP